MTIELKAKGAIQLPNNILRKYGLSKGSLFEITENEDGSINLMPIVIKPKKYMEELEKELAELRAEKAAAAEAAEKASEAEPAE